LGEAGVVEDRLGAAALAVELLRVARLLLAERAARDEHQDDEGEPAADGGLPVPGTPVPRAGREAPRLGGQSRSSPGGARAVGEGMGFIGPLGRGAARRRGVPLCPRPGWGNPPAAGAVIIFWDGTERGVPLDLRGPADVPPGAARL